MEFSFFHLEHLTVGYAVAKWNRQRIAKCFLPNVLLKKESSYRLVVCIPLKQTSTGPWRLECYFSGYYKVILAQPASADCCNTFYIHLPITWFLAGTFAQCQPADYNKSKVCYSVIQLGLR